MTTPRAPIPAIPVEHPLRAALAEGDRLVARSGPALRHMLAAQERSLVSEAVVAQVGGMLADMARQLVDARGSVQGSGLARAEIAELLSQSDDLRAHCQALALEWRLALRLEAELALDPVLSPVLQALVGEGGAEAGGLAMAALAAQARFAQAQRRMELPLGELPAELFHDVLQAARENSSPDEDDSASRADASLRSAYDEGVGRLALLARLADLDLPTAVHVLDVEEAGVALWLSALAVRSGESREQTACAASDPLLGRLLLTMRAAGLSPAEAERQALRAQPDAMLPRGLQDIGTREAAQWLAEARG